MKACPNGASKHVALLTNCDYHQVVPMVGLGPKFRGSWVTSLAPVNLHPLMSRSRNALIFTPCLRSFPPHSRQSDSVPLSLFLSFYTATRHFPPLTKRGLHLPSLNFFSVFLSFGLVISKLYPISLLGFFPLLRLWSFSSSRRISLQFCEGQIASRHASWRYMLSVRN